MTPEQAAHLSRVVASATKRKLPEVEWDKTWEADLDANLVSDLLIDPLCEEDVGGHWEDVGAGSYEYWGFRGYDSRPTVVAEPSKVVIKLKGCDRLLPVPPKFKVSYSGGGCDGEHRGRCRAACAEWDATVEWEMVHQEVHDGSLYVVVEGAQA